MFPEGLIESVSIRYFKWVTTCFIEEVRKLTWVPTPLIFGYIKIWAVPQEKLILFYANNKGPDKPAHQHSVICTFVIHLFERTSQLAACKISIF